MREYAVGLPHLGLDDSQSVLREGDGRGRVVVMSLPMRIEANTMALAPEKKETAFIEKSTGKETGGKAQLCTQSRVWGEF